MAQYTDVLNGNMDVGPIEFYAPIDPPSINGVTAVAASGTTLGVGAYSYRLAYATGNKRTNSQFIQSGQTPTSSPISVTTTSGNQAVSLGSLPTTWPTGAYLQLFRTAVGGVDGTEKLVTTFMTPQSTYTDTLADASLGAAMPTQNTTGTYIPGINALAHGGALTALLSFQGSVNTSRGVRGQFSRASAANNPSSLVSLPNDAPCYVPGKWGGSSQALSIWEGTTQLAVNSDFDTVTTTAQLFSGPLTSGAAWTVQSGSFTYSASGATSAAGGSIITAGNPVWKPLLGSDGSTSLPLAAQGTFTTPNPIITSGGSSWNGNCMLWQSAGNCYGALLTGTAFNLYKQVGGTYTSLANVAFTPAAATVYTITLELDHLGNLTAKLYLGSGTGGTLEATLTATDTSLSGGFLVGVGGDTGVIVSNASVTGPTPNTWGFGSDGSASGYQQAPWAIEASTVRNGTYAVSVNNTISTLSPWCGSANLAVSASTTYTASAYVNVISGTVGLRPIEETSTGTLVLDNGIQATIVGPTNGWQRISWTWTTQSTTALVSLRVELSGAGTAYFDCVQLEQKSYETPYLANSSTTATATRDTEAYSLPTQLFSAAEGSLVFSVNPQTLQNWLNYFEMTVSTGRFLFYIATDGSARFDYGAVNAGPVAVAGTFVVQEWYHVGLTWSATAGQMYLYVGGVLAGQTSFSEPSLASIPATIPVFSGPFGTNIGPISFFNAALTPAEVYSLYAATQPLVDALDTPIAVDVESYNVASTNPDANDVYQTATYTRMDGTTYMVSQLSNPVSGTSDYQTDVWTYYDATGTVAIQTTTWALTYDTSGKVASKKRT